MEIGDWRLEQPACPPGWVRTDRPPIGTRCGERWPAGVGVERTGARRVGCGEDGVPRGRVVGEVSDFPPCA